MVHRPHFMIALALCIAAAPQLADAQPKGKKQQPDKDKGGSDGSAGDRNDRSKKKDEKEKRFDFTGINFEGRLRTPQLLYFLDRASEELERASLERRSFIPEMVRSIDEESL